MADTHRYDAFISYRHVEPDRKWAKWLHCALETFKTPKPLVARGVPARIKRVFRDEDELPASADLSTEIDTALEQSRFLIVVCSPRTPESEWVNQEVVRFREMGRHDKILALLIEGEPGEAFPRALCEIRTNVTDEHGEVAETTLDVEPFAADVRESRDESPAFLKRMALLRCSAALLGCRFDDLRRREAERRVRRLVAIAASSLVIAVALVGLSVFALNEQARAEGEWTRAEAERDEKARALEEVERLADSKEARDLLTEVDDLWPIHPDTAPAMVAWIERVESVLANHSLHEKAIHSLRKRALPYEAEDRERDHAKSLARLASLQAALASAARQRAEIGNRADSTSLAGSRALAEEIAELSVRINEVDVLVKRRITWRFGDFKDGWKHQVLSGLLQDMNRLASADGQQGLLREVRERHVLAATLPKRSLEDHDLDWQRTIEGIAASPKYGGLRIAPQLGLVPLGPDPDSGLFEFAHLGSGTLPTRDPETARLAFEDDSAVVLVLIPGGTFLMGAQAVDPTQPNFDALAGPDEIPVHRVTLSPYLVSKFECTQAQWRCMTGGHQPSHHRAGTTVGTKKLTPRNPVDGVSWADCVLWLGRHRLDLPTEARWEHGCRAGSSSPWHTGRDESTLQDSANVSDRWMRAHGGPREWKYSDGIDDGYTVHAPVGSFAANDFGLHDMHGNVSELCKDGYSLYTASGAIDPLSTGARDFVHRGGSWSYVAGGARSAYRDPVAPGDRTQGIGVRPAARLVLD